ncbi:MAG: lipoyl(octanoyl) transferase LipB [Chloroflexi bacterium]|jgi:lipoate-protein ligase B|nr:lipoyl(octanoyl) transferase LipB [Chloroflexota bacterium]
MAVTYPTRLPPVQVSWLGCIPYDEAWALQQRLAVARADGRSPDRLLLLEHPPVYTLGRSAHAENLLLDDEALAAEGIAVRHVDRGGDITYHGPGQLVGYPILDLRAIAAAQGRSYPDLHAYLRALEETLIVVLAGLGIAARRYPDYTGVWVDERGEPEKIAAIGVKVSSRGITSHGFALNVAPNLAHFAGIIPCGIAEHGVTSIAALRGEAPALPDLVPIVSEAFAQQFNRRTLFVPAPQEA